MEHYGEVNVERILGFVEDAVVFTDNQCCECLHWLGGFKKLLEAGALDVRDIKHTKVYLYHILFKNFICINQCNIILHIVFFSFSIH